jgi:hypothetical protein
MQLTVDFDKTFIEELKEEFATTSITEALYKLLDFYKKNSSYIQENLEVIDESDGDYSYIIDARKRRENGEKTYSLDSVLKEFE